MSGESMGRFYEDVRRITDYFSSEFDLSYGEAIGVLQMLIMDLHAETMDLKDPEDEEEENGEHLEEGD